MQARRGAWADCSPGTAVELIGLSDGPHVCRSRRSTRGNTRTINRSFAVQVPITGGGDTTTGGGTTTITGGGTTTTTGAGTTTTGGGGGTTDRRRHERGGGSPKPPAFAPASPTTTCTPARSRRSRASPCAACPRRRRSSSPARAGLRGQEQTLKHAGGKLNVLKALKKLKLKAGATLVIAVRGEGGAQALARY